jgi:hypothetical protein
MAKLNDSTTQRKIERWIKEGRGEGSGADYKPWLRIQDVPSRGRSHRVKGWRHGRVHHLLSDLEANIFYTYEWSLSVLEIREQYPLLPFEETLSIAEELAIKHPCDRKTGHPTVMSTDFVLTIKQGTRTVFHARQAKYSSELDKPRTLEKLEIERRYWERRNVDYGIVTERDLLMVLVHNIKWLHPRYDVPSFSNLTKETINEIATVLTQMVLHEDAALRKITSDCDSRLKLSNGRSLSIARHLIATRYWKADMTKSLKEGERLILLNTPKSDLFGKAKLRA